MEISFLFWNTNQGTCLEEIKNIVNIYQIDVLILAENTATSAEILLCLNQVNNEFYLNHPLSQCSKVRIYTKFHFSFIPPIYETNRITVRKLALPTLQNFDLTLIGVHLGDKGNFNNESQSEMASDLSSQIKDLEKSLGHKRTIVVGDFNMNPFDTGMIKANGFHGVMSHKIANDQMRKIQSIEYDYFYNPMWSLFGDLKKENSGTYYYRRAELVNHQWNIFDQILVRSTLIKNLKNESIEILTSDGTKSLVNDKGIPKKELYSDHLPITFKLIF